MIDLLHFALSFFLLTVERFEEHLFIAYILVGFFGEPLLFISREKKLCELVVVDTLNVIN